ncbi:MAG: dihydrolipoyl dehydrogenase [Myxococcales bacterium]|jgi:dihydrolipoamide dehydrogenase|nr:dihydrolipoyl dehydrogenase [Myxococcales bacterium]
MSRTFDVVVVGAGPGGYVAALRSAQNGLSVALIEREKRLGGTCLLRGCIPTKSLLETARRLDELGRAADFGIEGVGTPTVELSKVMRRKERVIAKLAAGVGGLCRKSGVEVLQGTARLTSPHTVQIELTSGGEETIDARNVILATGSSVRDLPNLTPDHRRILTSDSALSLTELPKRLLVLGSGAVGIEFASIFRSFGAEVTVVELMERLLPIEDEEISRELERAFRRRGIGFFTSTKLARVETSGSGVHAHLLKADGTMETLEADALLVAVGRAPNTRALGLESAGIELDQRGFIPVDAAMRTRVSGVYAIGDIVASPALAHVASHEGRIAADAIVGKAVAPIELDRVPAAVYASPEVASVGLTEAVARARGIDARVGKFPFVAIGKANVQGETEGFAKLVADGATDRLIGAQLIGPHATELIAEIGAALATGATLHQMAEVIHAHPTLSEIVGEAALVGLGTPLHI